MNNLKWCVWYSKVPQIPKYFSLGKALAFHVCYYHEVFTAAFIGDNGEFLSENTENDALLWNNIFLKYVWVVGQKLGFFFLHIVVNYYFE